MIVFLCIFEIRLKHCLACINQSKSTALEKLNTIKTKHPNHGGRGPDELFVNPSIPFKELDGCLNGLINKKCM